MVSSAEAGSVFLTLENINLSYGTHQALRAVDLELRRGLIHAFVGEHGAGKTSLGLVIEGSRRPDTGRVHPSGRPYAVFTRKEAQSCGVFMVHQGIRLNGEWSVAENLFFGNPALASSPFRSYSPRKLEAFAGEFIEKEGLLLNPASAVRDLNFADQAAVAILRALARQPQLLILDEALEALSAVNREKFIVRIKGLAHEGRAVLLITHRIDELYEVADRVSILRDGQLLRTEDLRDLDKLNLLKIAYTQMAGGDLGAEADEEFYRLIKYNEAILKHLPLPVLVTDAFQRLRLANNVATALLGLSSQSLLDINLDDIVLEGKQEFLASLAPRTGRDEPALAYQILLQFNGRQPILANVVVCPIHDGPVFLGSVAILEDVTERERMREQMIFSEKLASVGLLAAGVAHEINNPLGIIYNDLESLKFVGPEASQRLQLVDDLEEQFEYIAAIVQNLVNFSDTKQPQKERLDLNELVRSIVRLVEPAALAREISISHRSDSGILSLDSNRNELKQVFLNLFKNSFEAMPEGGRVGIETKELPGGLVRIRFWDSGPGIKIDNPNDVFLPFTSTKRLAGTHLGLGLSVSYGIIKKHGGQMSIRNLPESGCEFTILLPVK